MSSGSSKKTDVEITNSKINIRGDEHLPYSKNPNWIQRRKELSWQDKGVYQRLRACGTSSEEYWASQEYLAHECGISVDSVQRSLRKLEKFNLISRKRNGKKMFNSYFFHMHVWMTEENKFSKCDTANMRITQSDTATARIVIPQERGSIYKDKIEKISNNIICSNVENLDTPTLLENAIGVHEEKKSKSLKVDQKLFDEKFEEFWKIYPRKDAKKPTRKIWTKIMQEGGRGVGNSASIRVLGNFSEELHQKILKNIQDRIKWQPEWSKNGSNWVLVPTTFLNQERWTDVVEPAGGVKTNLSNKQPIDPVQKKIEEEKERLEAKRAFERSMQEFKAKPPENENMSSVGFKSIFKRP